MSTIASLSIQSGLGLLLMVGLIAALRRANGYQHIYEDSPQSHQKKKNTVSFGGIGILGIFLFGQTLHHSLNPKSLWVTGTILCFALIGFIDDFIANTQKQNKGFSAKAKFLVQCTSSLILLSIWHTGIQALHYWEWPAYTFLLVGSSNATNLTDGLDGLLGGLSLISLIGFFTYAYGIGQTELALVCQSLAIGIACFLAFNLNPAKIFMGDTGSLAIGAGFASLAIAMGNPLLLIPLGAVYIIETLSVIIQVLSFRYRKKRIFLMSPLHHHFELLGLSEKQTVSLFWGIGTLCTGILLWNIS